MQTLGQVALRCSLLIPESEQPELRNPLSLLESVKDPQARALLTFLLGANNDYAKAHQQLLAQQGTSRPEKKSHLLLDNFAGVKEYLTSLGFDFRYLNLSETCRFGFWPDRGQPEQYDQELCVFQPAHRPSAQKKPQQSEDRGQARSSSSLEQF